MPGVFIGSFTVVSSASALEALKSI